MFLMPHLSEIRVRWSELDPYHHVNHAVYLTYFESARIEALAAIGFSMDRLTEAECQIVVTELNARFLVPALGGDHLVVETEVIEVRRASSRWRQRIMRGDEALVTIDLVGAITDLAGKPRRIPDGFAEALEQIAVS